LILSGSNSYRGGTYVYAGTLEVTSVNGLANGTNLTIDAGDNYIFGPAVAEAPAANSQTFAASPAATVGSVPEPGALALLSVAGIAAAVAVWRRKALQALKR
jgi:autotransporter-associated beta strand protein